MTEPLTNGSSTPESPKVETPAIEEPVREPAAASPAVERPEPKAETQPEQLPVNGLSLEEKIEAPEVAQSEESKPEEPTAETTETVPAPEIPVKKEVCVEQMPLESSPPPLPANPPPSSVVSFAATTMAPELTDASLANTAELTVSAPHSASDTDPTKPEEVAPKSQIDLMTTENVTIINELVSEIPLPVKDTIDENPVEDKIKPEIENIQQIEKFVESNEPSIVEVNVTNLESNVDTFQSVEIGALKEEQIIGKNLQDHVIMPEEQKVELKTAPEISLKTEVESKKVQNTVESVVDTLDNSDDLPLPPPLNEDIETQSDTVEQIETDDIKIQHIEISHVMNENVVNSNHMSDKVDIDDVTTENSIGIETQEKLKNKTKDLLGNEIDTVECNGNIEKNIPMQQPTEPAVETNNFTEESGRTLTPEESMPPSLSEASESLPATGGASDEASEAFPPPPADLCPSPTDASEAAAEPPQVNTVRAVLPLVVD